MCSWEQLIVIVLNTSVLFSKGTEKDHCNGRLVGVSLVSTGQDISRINDNASVILRVIF